MRSRSGIEVSAKSCSVERSAGAVGVGVGVTTGTEVGVGVRVMTGTGVGVSVLVTTGTGVGVSVRATTGTGVGVEVVRSSPIRGTISTPVPRNSRLRQQQRESTMATTIAMIERLSKTGFLSSGIS